MITNFVRATQDAPPYLYALYNGKASGGHYGIGVAHSRNHVDWNTEVSAVLSASAAWEGSDVFQPWLVKDGSQYVCYYAANSPSTAIGRATASDPTGTWTKYASNPVISVGTGTDPDATAMNGPVVYYSSDLSPAWKMWYAGESSGGTFTVCFADSSDGIAWTKRGSVIGKGSAGSFNELHVVPGCVLLSGSTWYVFVAGVNAAGNYHSGYATCTDPASSATYSALSQLSNYTGNITAGGRTWQKNQPRVVYRDGQGLYRCGLSVWAPTDTSTILEGAVWVRSSDLTSWETATSLSLKFETWASISSENMTIVESY